MILRSCVFCLFLILQINCGTVSGNKEKKLTSSLNLMQPILIVPGPITKDSLLFLLCPPPPIATMSNNNICSQNIQKESTVTVRPLGTIADSKLF